jgi:hypothetical protein
VGDRPVEAGAAELREGLANARGRRALVRGAARLLRRHRWPRRASARRRSSASDSDRPAIVGVFAGALALGELLGPQQLLALILTLGGVALALRVRA